MLGLSTLGAVHTAFALVAVVCGYAMLLRFGRISAELSLGKTYIVGTAISCFTSFGIFMHGGFNVAHSLGILTLVVLGVAAVAGRSRETSRLATYVETIGLSLTLFFHMIPGLTETFTRFPMGSPLFSGPEDPKLQKVVGFAFLLFLIIIALQIRHIWKAPTLMRCRTGLA
ncbi:hypothetical protein [Cupriavidus necator]|uniref:hypothetical protein n=1 Tax=Cupriavidus necator TaxID=106590 RepID=UPI0005B3A10F|nr:hypothetical protein [Cupriavidus necator]